MFLPPYNADGLHTVSRFTPASLWPIYSKANSTTGDAFNYELIHTVTPFARGDLEINPANAGLFLNGSGISHRFGNEVISRSEPGAGLVHTAIKATILDGIALHIKGSSFTALQPLDEPSPIGYGNILGGPLLMMDNMYPPFNLNRFYDCYVYNAGVHGAASYALVRTPFYSNVTNLLPIPTSDLSKHGFRNWDAWYAFNDSTLPGGFFNYVPKGCIPDPINGINHFVMTNTDLNPSGLIHWQCNALLQIGSLDPVVLDDSALQTVMNFGSGIIQATTFGWLINGGASSTYAPGMFATIMLLSPDMTKYSLVKLLGQNPTVDGDIQNGSVGGGLAVHIDPTGNVYLWGGVDTRIDSSFSISIPWPSVTLPTLGQPSFTIPSLCGCDPIATLGLTAKDLGGIYG